MTVAPAEESVPRSAVSASLPRNAAVGRPALAGAAFFLAACCFVLLPGDNTSFFPGVPVDFRTAGPALLAAGFIAFLGRPRPGFLPVLASLCLLKLLVYPATIQHGLVGTYYSTSDLSGPIEQVRLDKAINFKDDTFPLAFFNEQKFDYVNPPIDRDQLPFSVRWTGYIPSGEAEVESDQQVTRSSSEITFRKGWAPHAFIKLAGDGSVFPKFYTDARLSVGRLALAVDDALGLAFGVLLVLLLPSVRWSIPSAAFIALSAQGYVSSWSLSGKTPIFAGGQDWLRYEAEARDVLAHGWLMNGGADLFSGKPFYAQEFYAYYVALGHLLTGSEPAGIIFSHYLLLGAGAVFIFLTSDALFGGLAATTALLLFIWLSEKYLLASTDLLLSENLAYALVAGGIYYVCSACRSKRTADAAAAGLLLALAADTRSTVLPFVAVCVALFAASGRWRQTAAFSLITILALAVVPVRNYLVSGQPALLPTYGFHNIRYTHPLPADVHYSAAPGTNEDRQAVIAYIEQRPFEFIRQSVMDTVPIFGIPTNRTAGDVLENAGILLLWLLWIAALFKFPVLEGPKELDLLRLFTVLQAASIFVFGVGGVFVQYGLRIGTLAYLCMLPPVGALLAEWAIQPQRLNGVLALAVAGSAIPLPGPHLPQPAPAIAAINRDIRIVQASFPSQVTPGEIANLDLIWFARTAPHAAYMLFYRAIDSASGATAFKGEAPPWPLGSQANPWDNSQPTATWVAGDELPGQYRVTIPVDLSAGAYELEIGMYSRRPDIVLEDGKLLVPFEVASSHAPGEPDRLFSASGLRSRQALGRLGPVELDGAQAESGDVELVWRDLAPLDEDYQVFVHVIDRQGQLIAQHDAAPAGGAWPTSAWTPGDVITDRHPLSLPPNADHLEIGMYRLPSGTRLRGEAADSIRIPIPPE